ncbi:low temperature requirement protein A [Psychrobacter sp. YP14]|jgi:low temperature requirement protein LtrA|uniref:Low temperature requirement A n=2 Tax=Psychrobacter TaxID=497 RepID=A5WHL7_PSYWF|nr:MULTISPECIES: low temperature requirement protein A [unclassified Psychrobacter]AWT49916.1 low temperature requirement protein A [Psychrobacter sp. YP14]
MSLPHIWPISARDTHEPNRASTPLELLFDLVYVIAISAAAQGLYKDLLAHEYAGFITFTVAFFILWNAWSSFTWFGSGYDPDDLPYRISVMMQMFGSLLIAANIHQFFEQGLIWIGVAGYAIMRLASCSQWWRVYRHVPGHKKVAGRSIFGLITLQLMWISWLFLPAAIKKPALFLFITAELLMPIWARSEQFDNWHPRHIAERYGLLTIIVLGEGILGVSQTILHFLISPAYSAFAIIISGSALVALLFAVWWLYFSIPFDDILDEERRRHDFVFFGYGHFFIFAALTGLGSTLKLVTEIIDETSEITAQGISQSYTMAMIMLQLASFLLALITLRALMCRNSSHNMVAVLASLVILALSYTMVHQGISITYGIWFSVLAPLSLIALFNWDNKTWAMKSG